MSTIQDKGNTVMSWPILQLLLLAYYHREVDKGKLATIANCEKLTFKA